MPRGLEASAFAEHLDDEIKRRLGEEASAESGEVVLDPRVEAALREDITTEYMLSTVSEVGALEEVQVRHIELRLGTSSGRLNGYAISVEEDRIDLIVTVCRQGRLLVDVPAQDVQRAVDQVWRFFTACRKSVPPQLSAGDEAFAIARHIFDSQSRISHVRIFALVQGRAGEFRGNKSIRVRADGQLDVRVHVWDLERVSRCVQSGNPRESIEVDFIRDYGAAIPCLPVTAGRNEPGAYLAVIPGDVLYRLYDEYGERLLELNVRSFLQARGKVNRGIRETILRDPKRFFAYNNGLSAVAEEVRTARAPNGMVQIDSVRGLQIVNGGQTTASLHRAVLKDRADLSGVFVQAKLTVVPPDEIESTVPLISLFANSQNKVNDADFTANDPFHLRLEELSRTVWTPDFQTRWFYERARGQYQVSRNKLSAVDSKEFERTFPVEQMFTKTDMATYVHCWAGLPHLVSLGAQKNFREFTLDFQRGRGPAEPDEVYFRELVAKAIIFRRAQGVARETRIGAYRANIVAYSVAYLSAHAREFVDLDSVWRNQCVPEALSLALMSLLPPIEAVIKESAAGRNVTEWCKKEECWEYVRQKKLRLPTVLTTRVGRKSRSRKAGSSEDASTASEGAMRGERDRAELVSAVVADFRRRGREVVDMRPVGGVLWVLGGEDLSVAMQRLREQGLMPIYCAEGSRSTDSRPAWYIRTRA
ncbi:AIPR family protein [Corallococcus exiguus]|uniref:AIPR family protein n=1 Tax=Corallococcus exiguus TaxID=83462 RepID=UPI00155F9B2C|nr:AIPR family protein [Corallococcus exiguus]NRD48800.1 AIPR family protein [Corallococcus exiguus]